jgi:hypothetical protein
MLNEGNDNNNNPKSRETEKIVFDLDFYLLSYILCAMEFVYSLIGHFVLKESVNRQADNKNSSQNSSKC